MYYDKKGKKIDINKWGELQRKKDYKIIKQEALPNYKRVSTVWIGINYSCENGQPLIFETMVFPEDSWGELDCQRYSTLEEAIIGHKEMVKKWLTN